MAQQLTPAHVQFLMDNGLRRILRNDDSAEHQIRMGVQSGTNQLFVSCNCMRIGGGGYGPIELRSCWEPGEAIARYREHLNEVQEATA